MPRLIVLTGGPGAGKTAVLEIVRRNYCEHVVVLPEAATIVFGGGFPRGQSPTLRRAGQRAILGVQRELERIEEEERRAALVLCDRGLIDGLAYWPDTTESYFESMSLSRDACLARYVHVIHLRPPSVEHGYDHSNPVRTESAAEAAQIDRRIEEAWEGVPSRTFVPSSKDFLTKAAAVLAALDAFVPRCCQEHSRGLAQ